MTFCVQFLWPLRAVCEETGGSYIHDTWILVSRYHKHDFSFHRIWVTDTCSKKVAKINRNKKV